MPTPETHTVSVVRASKLAVGDTIWNGAEFAPVTSIEMFDKHLIICTEQERGMYFKSENVLLLKENDA